MLLSHRDHTEVLKYTQQHRLAAGRSSMWKPVSSKIADTRVTSQIAIILLLGDWGHCHCSFVNSLLNWKHKLLTREKFSLIFSVLVWNRFHKVFVKFTQMCQRLWSQWLWLKTDSHGFGLLFFWSGNADVTSLGQSWQCDSSALCHAVTPCYVSRSSERPLL